MRLFCLFLPAILFAATLHADRVETLDGSIIYGSILGVTDHNLTFLGNYSSEPLRIPLSEVRSLASSESLTVRDDKNQTLSGQSVALPSGSLNLRNQDGTQRLAYQNIQHLWPASGTDPLLAEELVLQESMRMKWENSIGFDLTGSSGNTDSVGLGLRVDSIYFNLIHELDAYLAHNARTTNGTTDVEETRFGAEYDSIFREGLAWYLRSDFEHDRIENIDIRLTGALGLKYDWMQEENYQVSTRAGAALRYEQSSLASVGSTNDPALDLGLDYSHRLNDTLSLSSEVSLIPRIDDLGDYLFHHDIALQFPTLADPSWSLKSGLSGTYNTTPSAGLEKSDFKYYLRLVYDFE